MAEVLWGLGHGDEVGAHPRRPDAPLGSRHLADAVVATVGDDEVAVHVQCHPTRIVEANSRALQSLLHPLGRPPDSIPSLYPPAAGSCRCWKLCVFICICDFGIAGIHLPQAVVVTVGNEDGAL